MTIYTNFQISHFWVLQAKWQNKYGMISLIQSLAGEVVNGSLQASLTFIKQIFIVMTPFTATDNNRAECWQLALSLCEKEKMLVSPSNGC